MGSLDIGATEEMDFFHFLLLCWVVAIVFFFVF